MKKILYMSPITEVVKLNMNATLLTGSPYDDSPMPDPSHPGAPAARSNAPVSF